MKTEEPTTEQRTSDLNPAKKPSLLFIISTSLGVLTIIAVAASYYSGLIGH